MKWTEQAIRDIIKKCPNVRHFHHYYRGAEKAAKKLGILDSLFPNKQVHSKEYSIEQIHAAAKAYTKRSEFQLHHPSMYNAAQRLNIVKELFPIQLNKKTSHLDLKIRASKHISRSDFELNDNKGYQIAQKRGILNEICPPKIQGTSKAEKALLDFLQVVSIDFKSKRFKNDYELDCYSETLNIGVEYNGLYWHSEDNKPNNYHYKKTKYFEALGIRVIHIWEHEWRDREEQVKDFLRSACGANANRIGARKCEFKEVSRAEAKAFLANTHIQGAPNAVKYALGAYKDGVLLGVCTFGAHHRNGTDVVLNRFACSPNITVQGFVSKASKMAGEKFGTIYSWADYAKSQARGYLAAGWEIVQHGKPDYFYTDVNYRYISKQSRRKSAVGTPTGMTESEHAKADGLYRVWDCGKILLRYIAQKTHLISTPNQVS